MIDKKIVCNLSFLDQVAEQSRENLHSISTLKDFQYLEEGKDQGINVREKAKSMVTLLKVRLNEAYGHTAKG